VYTKSVKFGTMLQGNVGDSRAVASMSGRVEELSFDHKPSNELETKRIVEAGGWVEFNRVNGACVISCHLAFCVEPEIDTLLHITSTR